MMLRNIALVTVALVFMGWQAKGQDAAAASAPEAAAQPQSAAQPAAEAVQAAPAQAAQAPSAAPAKPVAPAETKSKGKSKKVEYTGPDTIVELPATPMLDELGAQRLDPDGKPMWNPPVKQQRDKHGHPLFDDNGKPVFQTASDKGYDEHGKKIKVVKEKEPKKIPVSISRGTMTVDGMTGKAALNYDIADLKYIYLYAPGIGVAVVSNEPFPGATEQKSAFNGNTLTVTIGEHTLQLASDKQMLGKKAESAYVLVDRQFTLPSRFPVMGYGTVRKAPYMWPGAKPYQRVAGDDAPPPPADLLPAQMLAACPAGQMRKVAGPVLPGQTAPAPPCVPIKTATAVATAASTATPAVAAPTPAAAAASTNAAAPSVESAKN
jgi:hypothetical protein